MSDLDGLTREQAEKVLQFQDLTGMMEVPVCIEILRQYEWDLNLAVYEVLGSAGEGFESAVNSVSIWMRMLQTVYYFIRNTLSRILQILLPNARSAVTDPEGDVLSFIHYYEQKHGNKHPVFYSGSYSQALSMAKQDLRFLLVYLHCEEHQDTTKFCEETLPNPDIIQLINTTMLFWACSVTSPEGYRVSQTLRENGYPFLAMIAPVEGKMTVVGRLEGATEPADLIVQLSTIMADNDETLSLARAERYQLSLNQALRQQQDQDYLESLLADQEKERRRREAREVEFQNAFENQQRKQLIALQKRELASKIPEEPLRHDPKSVQIVFKLPNGTRLERRFLKSHSLKLLYYYVFCNPASPDSFEITTSFPKKVLKCQEEGDDDEIQTLEEAGLGCNEVLFVRDLEA